MTAKIYSINAGSLAEKFKMLPGDELISINGEFPKDLIDYRFIEAQKNLTIVLKRENGQEETFKIKKADDEDLGINFEYVVFDKILPCTNKCVFCFVDQQPSGLRESLYVKDDDYRLSYLQGTYITLTNLTSSQKKRIEQLGLGPLYVSVHTTNPELREFMLKNPKAGNIMNDLKWLNEVFIPVHLQIVLCPGINDGKELDRTFEDLLKVKSNILSIAVVPVGITKYRDGELLKPVDKDKAVEVIGKIADFNKKIGRNLAFPSDEFYILAEQNLPKSSTYEGFGQLDDGVGVCNVLLDDFKKHSKKLPKKLKSPKKFTIATGQIASKALNPIIEKLNTIENLSIELLTVKSNFWGEQVTVSGLITGQDLIDNILPIKNEISNLVIPSVMIRKFSDEFLDSLTLSDVERKLNLKIIVIDDYYSTKELIDLIIS